MNQIIYNNGELYPKNRISIDPFSASLLYGLSVFEGIRYYYNSSTRKMLGFRVHEHYLRFVNSIKVLRINYDIMFDDYQNAIEKTIEANKLNEDAYVRTTLLLDGDASWHGNGIPTLMITAVSKPSLLKLSDAVVNAGITHWQRLDDSQMSPRIKVGSNYVNSRLAYLDVKHKGFANAIMLNRKGQVSEGPGACLFIVRDNQLITPSVDQSILESITRDSIIQIAHTLGIKVVERPVDKTELFICDEAFYAGTMAEITPIGSVDGYPMNKKVPGEVTQKLFDAFKRVSIGEENQFKSWNYPIHD